MLISDEYKRLNEELHDGNDDFGAMAFHLGPAIAKLCKNHKFTSILDYGCGKGTLAQVLSKTGLAIGEYDPGIPGKDSPPQSADLVVCIDVMEHVEPDCIEDVLAHIASLTKAMAYFLIDNGPAKKTLPDGRNAHLTVQPYRWWKRALKRHFDLKMVTSVNEFETADGGLLRIPAGATLAVAAPKAPPDAAQP